ncbi:retrovirus-related pol polyprotein from transposon TNT 1-94 [Tanacetum coccineum]
MRDNVTSEATHADLFGDETEMDMSNLNASYQIRGMTKTVNEQGLLSAVYERKPHEDLNTCMFFCFLSEEEPKRVTKALSDSAWVEAMQEELLQFKLQKVWILVDLPKGKRAIARIKAIRLFLAYASFMGFMVYQMDVKSAFLYGQIEEKVYVCQPPGFEDLDYPYKRKDRSNLVYQKAKGGILLIQVYVDDIIFGSTKKELCLEFEKLMHDKFHMSSIGELTVFLGLQVKQKEDGIFISQDKYVTSILKKFGFQDVRTASTPMDTENPMLKDLDGDGVDVHLYRLMIGSLMYLTSSRPDIMFACKKQTVVATSSTEAKYVVAASCCGQDKQIEYLMLNASPLKHVKRGRDTKIPQSSGPPVKVGDEAVHKELGDRMERAATTASSLEAEQDSGNINRTQSMATLNEPSP